MPPQAPAPLSTDSPAPPSVELGDAETFPSSPLAACPGPAPVPQ